MAGVGVAKMPWALVGVWAMDGIERTVDRDAFTSRGTGEANAGDGTAVGVEGGAVAGAGGDTAAWGVTTGIGGDALVAKLVTWIASWR
jgi:hypothetical protein